MADDTDANLQAIADSTLRQIALQYGSTTKRDFRVIEIVLEQIAAVRAENADLLAELHNIANANTKDWDDPSDFKAWAQSRARHTLAKTEGRS